MSAMVSDLVVVPHLFKCPISLDVMKDPVTLSTGVTYDRHSIQTWFREGHNTCPLTMQPLGTTDLTPNLTLRRLIQSWRPNNWTAAINPADDFQISNLLNTLQRNPFSLSALESLQSLATTSSTNRSFIASSAAPCLLIRTINKSRNNFAYENNGVDHNMVECGETALAALAVLRVKSFKEESLKSLHCKMTMESVSYFLTRASSLASRLCAAQLLREILVSGNNLRSEFRPDEETFWTLSLLVRKGASLEIKRALEVLLMICPVRRNSCHAVNAGVADAALEMLVDADRNICEKGLVLLEILCHCAEGRAAVSGHHLGVHLLVKKIARVSQIATEAAASALWLIYTNCKSPAIVQEMEEAGAYNKFLLLLQIGCSSSTRRKAKEIIREHKKNSSCVVGSPCILVSNETDNAIPTHMWDMDANTLDMIQRDL